MSRAMDRAGVVKTYDRWAPVYDLVFGQVFEKARKSAIAACEAIGGRVLEVGIGTGISLPYYTERCRIVGVDISAAMLEVARQRVTDLRMTNVERLAIMDVQNLEFADGSFDVVTAQYVVNTVPDPEAALDEFMRVLRPGGELIVVNRVGADKGARLKAEKLIEPIVERLGWRSDFPWARFENWMRANGNVTLAERKPLPPLGHFALLRFRKEPAGAQTNRSLVTAA
ncbi:MAG TPA: class I SAM-dependent methyltransferase [Hyphomicrobiaceae bacterium]|nr:class I SAM-dependent methyltransferase [Hyphomicrobiaceae bacterium]